MRNIAAQIVQETFPVGPWFSRQLLASEDKRNADRLAFLNEFLQIRS